MVHDKAGGSGPMPSKHPGRSSSQEFRLDAALQLLDHQLIDSEGRLAGKIDDLELIETDDGQLVVSAILAGPGALGPRLPGVLGRSMVALWRRLHEAAEPRVVRIPWSAVAEVGSAVTLSGTRAEL